MRSHRDPKCVFNFLRFFEIKLYKSNYTIFISSWCGTHTKIRSKLVDIVTAGSQKITLWAPRRSSLGILRVNVKYQFRKYKTRFDEMTDYVYINNRLVHLINWTLIITVHNSFLIKLSCSIVMHSTLLVAVKKSGILHNVVNCSNWLFD